MRAIVLFDPANKMERVAMGVVEGLKQVGFDVDVRKASEQANERVSLAPYHLVCVGAPIVSFFGGQLGSDIDMAIRQCSRIEGKPAAVFVAPRLFGTGKGLKRLMAMLERQGAIVQDFAPVRSHQEAVAFGRRLDVLSESN